MHFTCCSARRPSRYAFDGADHFVDARRAEFRKGRRKGVEDFDTDRGAVERGRADLHGAGPGDKEFHHVVDRRNAADPHQRHAHRLRHLKHGPQGDRLDGRPAQPAQHSAQTRPATAPVDGHPQAGVDQRDGVGPAGLGPAGDLDHAGDVGRELGQHRQRAGPADSRNDPLAHPRVGAEVDAPADVRAGDIQLQGGDSRHSFQPSPHADELVVALAGDTNHHRGAQTRQVRKLAADEGFDAVVVQADRIEHYRGRLDRPRRRIAGARLLSNGLGQDRPEPAQVHQARHFAGVAKGAGGDHYRVRETEASELDGQRDRSRVHRQALGDQP